jgi:hypothetical protein
LPINGASGSLSKNGPNGVARTTSTFTTGGDQSSTSGGSPNDTASTAAAGWNSFNGSTGGFSDQPTLGGGFGDQGDDQRPSGPGRTVQEPVSQSITIPRGTGEAVIVTMLPEKEGMFLFQHHNYEVKTIRRGSTVVRRYSDFVWLLDCLHKRYPFRRLPLLPPKRVQRKKLVVPYNQANYGHSQWQPSCVRRSYFPRQAEERLGQICECSCTTSHFEPGNTSRNVLDCANSKSPLRFTVL